MFRDRFVFRRQDGQVPGSIHRGRNVAVTGTGRGTGATFTATGLCCFFSDKGLKVSYTEVAEPSKAGRLIYDALALDKRLGKEEIVSVYKAVKDMGAAPGRVNVADGISWRVITGEDADEGVNLTEGETLRLVNTAEGDVKIFDICAEDRFDCCLMDMDMIVAVIDPLPSRMMRQGGRIRMLKRMKAAGNRVVWVVNRMNTGVSRRQIQGFLREEQILFAGEAPAEKIYTAEFRCTLPHREDSIMAEYDSVFTKISQSLGI